MRNLGLLAGAAVALAGVGMLTGLAATSSAASAAQVRVATFAVGNMTCATCPIAVKTAMSKVAGVRSVAVNFEAKTATVQFDPAKTDTAQIAAASTGIGFPAKLAQ
jgi:mercuric ion binding protein